VAGKESVLESNHVCFITTFASERKIMPGPTGNTRKEIHRLANGLTARIRAVK